MTSSPRLPRPGGGSDREAIGEAAAGWLARREGGLTAAEQAAFDAWLGADPRHAAAVRELELGWRYLQRPRFTGQADVVAADVERRVRRGRRRRRRMGALALAGLAVAALVVLSRPPAADAPPMVAERGIVEVMPERRNLPDGSVVELNLGAEVAVAFAPDRREVRLLRGEAHFSVVGDAARPFVVQAGSVSVRAIGTAFAVRFEPAAVDVLVTEGRVAVERADPSLGAAPLPSATFVRAGARVVVPVDVPVLEPLNIQPVALGEMEVALAWRGMRMEFTATRLGDVVARFNRLNRLQLVLADRVLEDLRISGIFWANDPEGFSRLIGESAGLEIAHLGDDRILLRSQLTP